jgi:hypothetical protein
MFILTLSVLASCSALQSPRTCVPFFYFGYGWGVTSQRCRRPEYGRGFLLAKGKPEPGPQPNAYLPTRSAGPRLGQLVEPARQGMAKSRTPLGAHTSAWRTYPDSDLLPHRTATLVESGSCGSRQPASLGLRWSASVPCRCRCSRAVVDQSRRPDDGPGPVHMHALTGLGNHSCVCPGPRPPVCKLRSMTIREVHEWIRKNRRSST